MRLRQILSEARQPFQLDPNLDPEKYKITDNLSQWKKWRAYTYMGDGRTNEGEMGEIHYVMINIENNYIIPISRGDEHHRGYDLLRELDGISTRNYVPVSAPGREYIFNSSDIEKLLPAIKKHLEYGGVDGVVNFDMQAGNALMSYKQFVQSGGKVKVKPGELAYVGQKIYDGFVQLSQVYEKARKTNKPSDIGAAFRATDKFLAMIVQYALPSLYTSKHDIRDFFMERDWLKEMAKEKDITTLENTIFGFNGLKNDIHVSLKELENMEKRHFRYRDAVKVWGDIELAIEMLARI